MPRYHATSAGQVAFTAQEELDRDAEEAAYLAAQQDPDTPENIKKRKKARASDVAAITVTVGSQEFDGDEESQLRMYRQIFLMELDGVEECEWTLADDSRETVTLITMKEALRLSVVAQNELWALE